MIMKAEYFISLFKWHRDTYYPSSLEKRRNSYNRYGPKYVNLLRDVSSLDRLRNAISSLQKMCPQVVPFSTEAMKSSS